jgi:predicted CXXCH cytochrome family protein
MALLVFTLTAQAANATGAAVNFRKCLSCHPDVQEELTQKGAHVPFMKLECSSCHNPHAARYENLVKEKIGKLCRGCHQGNKGVTAKKYTHEPFKEGACLACHRPHASKNRGLLKAKGEELCFECHAKEGSFSKKNKHDPVKKARCVSCHNPHTSDHEALAKMDRRELCVTCHSVKNKRTQKAHLRYPVQGTDCMSCHNPHGSNRGGLVKESQHEPFARERCRTCHNGLQSENPLGLKGRGASICASCHPGTQEEFKKVNSHVDKGVFCVNCHSPHASDQGAMRKAREAKICLSCHQDTKGRIKDTKNEHRHPLLMEGKCVPCHRPHGSNFTLFFGADEIKACTECHQRHAKFTHPIGKEAIDPRSKRDITCITCHNLMGSPNEFALRFDRKKQLCVQCHKGY